MVSSGNLGASGLLALPPRTGSHTKKKIAVEISGAE